MYLPDLSAGLMIWEGIRSASNTPLLSPGYVYYVFVLIRIVKFLEKSAVIIRPFE
jgi:hypothetical protein